MTKENKNKDNEDLLLRIAVGSTTMAAIAIIYVADKVVGVSDPVKRFFKARRGF